MNIIDDPVAKITILGNPLSDNHLYGYRAFGKRVIKYMTKTGKNYKDLCKLSTQNKGFPCVSGPLSMLITVYFGDKRKRDIHGHLKALIDGFNGILYNDDSQIIEIVARKEYSKELPRSEVVVYAYETEKDTF